MQRISPKLIEECRSLRKQGATLGEIVRAIHLPKTTVYSYIVHIPVPPATRERILIASTKRINDFNIRERRGKCAPGRVVYKPETWSDGLVFLLAHFLFDGGIRRGTCIYSNRSINLVKSVEKLVKRVFGIMPKSITKDPQTGVYRIAYHYIELSDYVADKTQELYRIVRKGGTARKRLFLRAFFDDEGNITFNMRKNKRQVRGFQHNITLLRLVHDLLSDFGIRSRIDEKYKEIVISRRENLIKFRERINFSKGVFINPERTNSLWKRKLSKRQLLSMAIESYLPAGSPGVHHIS